MEWKRIELKFSPLKISKQFYTDRATLSKKKLLHEVDAMPSYGTIPNYPPAIKLKWFFVIKENDKVMVQLDADDTFQIMGINEYKTNSGKETLREMINNSYKEVFKTYELAKNQLQIITPVPQLKEWDADSVLIAVEQLLDKSL